MKNWKEITFAYCYDCGYGEKGCISQNNSFENAFRLSGMSNEEEFISKLDYFNGWFELFNGTHFIIEQANFDREDWEGSQDY